jgi:hypothetical protein
MKEMKDKRRRKWSRRGGTKEKEENGMRMRKKENGRDKRGCG